MDRALAAGKIAEVGVSNATCDDLRAVLALCSGPLRAAFTHVQNEFNLLHQRDLAERDPPRAGAKAWPTSPSAPSPAACSAANTARDRRRAEGAWPTRAQFSITC